VNLASIQKQSVYKDDGVGINANDVSDAISVPISPTTTTSTTLVQKKSVSKSSDVDHLKSSHSSNIHRDRTLPPPAASSASSATARGRAAVYINAHYDTESKKNTEWAQTLLESLGKHSVSVDIPQVLNATTTGAVTKSVTLTKKILDASSNTSSIPEETVLALCVYVANNTQDLATKLLDTELDQLVGFGTPNNNQLADAVMALRRRLRWNALVVSNYNTPRNYNTFRLLDTTTHIDESALDTASQKTYTSLKFPAVQIQDIFPATFKQAKQEAEKFVRVLFKRGEREIVLAQSMKDLLKPSLTASDLFNTCIPKTNTADPTDLCKQLLESGVCPLLKVPTEGTKPDTAIFIMAFRRRLRWLSVLDEAAVDKVEQSSSCTVFSSKDMEGKKCLDLIDFAVEFVQKKLSPATSVSVGVDEQKNDRSITPGKYEQVAQTLSVTPGTPPTPATDFRRVGGPETGGGPVTDSGPGAEGGPARVSEFDAWFAHPERQF
jgi:hypothetical protein